MPRVKKPAPKRFKGETRKCKFCRLPFLARRRWSVFCSADCRGKFHKSGGARGAIMRDTVFELFEEMPTRLAAALEAWDRERKPE